MLLFENINDIKNKQNISRNIHVNDLKDISRPNSTINPINMNNNKNNNNKKKYIKNNFNKNQNNEI